MTHRSTPSRRAYPSRLASLLAAALIALVACTATPMTNAARPEPQVPRSTDMELRPVRHISIAIARSPGDVYRYAADPEHVPVWASGLARSIRNVDGVWTADSPLGRITISFAPSNALGVLDHDITLPSGATVHNAMRVVPNGNGSEVVFSLFQLPGVPDDQFERDASWVARDLQALERALED